jgi:sugar-specific transcriptional regulator TrmB
MLEKLKEIGLTEKEIQILKTLFENEHMTILEMSKRTRISRTYCYEALENLLNRGFVSKVILNKKTAWRANPSEKILNYIDLIKKEIREELTKISLKNKRPEEKINVNLYKGKNGIRAICERELDSKTKVIGWGAEGQLEKHMPFYYEHFKNQCIKRGLKADFIIMKPLSRLASKNVNSKHFPKYFETFVEINVFDNRTILFFWKEEPEAIEIVNKNVADSFRNYHKFFGINYLTLDNIFQPFRYHPLCFLCNHHYPVFIVYFFLREF